VPDPRKIRIRVYETDSVHKSMSWPAPGLDRGGTRRGLQPPRVGLPRSRVHPRLDPRPNAQIIASLDVARRQMELEGYELVMRSIENALAIRPRGGRAPHHLEILSACSAPIPWSRTNSAPRVFKDFLSPGSKLGHGRRRR